jgi:putative acetyltransferase
VYDEENSVMLIRQETEADIEANTEITKPAFENHAFSRNTEQFIIHALRAANALTVSLVSEIDGTVVGHIAFSPVTFSGGRHVLKGYSARRRLDTVRLGPIGVDL